MPGIFSAGDSQLRVRGLRIDAVTGEASIEGVDLRVDIWDHWLLIAQTTSDAANAANAKVIASHVARDDESLGQCLEEEFRASMTSIAASAFAIDAIYGRLVNLVGPHPHTDIWNLKKLARHKRIAETIHYTYKSRAVNIAQVSAVLAQLFDVRDRAVHPSAEFQPPEYRDDIDRAVEWRFQLYRASNAAAAFVDASGVIEAILRDTGRASRVVQDWAVESRSKFARATGREVGSSSN